MQQQNSTWPSGVEYALLSDIGLRRANNQDSYAVALAASQDSWENRGHLFLVADGMGAHAAGELASKLAADTVPQTYRKRTDLAPEEALRTAVEQANEVIHGRGEDQLEFHGMGTTASALLLLPRGALVAHVGDSRVYRLRGDRLDQLSFDHSLVWEMISSGQVREENVPAYIPKNVITRSLGPNAKVEVDREGPFPLAIGDTFLLCSDGLTGQVKDEELGAILGALGVQEAAQALVDLANLRGGPDNITVIVVRIVGQHLTTGANGKSQPLLLPRAAASPRATLYWILPLAASMLALLLAAARSFVAAGIAAAVTAVLALVGIALRRLDRPVEAEAPPPALGRAPYRTKGCVPDRAFATRLADVVDQVRQAAAEQRWSIDWEKFHEHEARARSADERQDFRAAVRAYCQSMSFLMGELRHQRAKPEA